MTAVNPVTQRQAVFRFSAHQRGWAASEYLAVLAGLVVVWRGAELVLAMIQEHHDKFMWALLIPY